MLKFFFNFLVGCFLITLFLAVISLFIAIYDAFGLAGGILAFGLGYAVWRSYVLRA